MKDNKRNRKKSYFWNTLAGLVNAAEAIVLSMVVTRTAGLEASGTLSLAFATGNTLMALGKFGTRAFQVTDVKREYSFETYKIARIITCAFMLILAVGNVIYGINMKGYGIDKAATILVVCLIYVMEAYEDVYLGNYQLCQRLDLSGKVFVTRWITIICVTSIMLCEKNILCVSLAIGFVVGTIIQIVLIRLANNVVFEDRGSKGCKDLSTVFRLLWACLPLAIMQFLNFYIINVPKYSIDANLNDKVQACYGFVAMPVFVISLLNGFIYQPMLVSLATDYNEGYIERVKYKIKRQLLIIVGITLVCEIGAYLLGIPVLSFLYNTNLKDYKTELLIMLLGGGILATAGFLGIMLTIIRRKKEQLYGYIVATAVSIIIADPVVTRFGVRGAAVLYVVLISIVAVINGIQLFYFLQNEGKG